MTTIVYDHKKQQIACDSRETADGFIVTDEAIKYKWSGSDIWFMCGAKADIDLFIEEFEHNSEVSQNISCSGLLVRDGITYKACNTDGIYKLDVLPSNEGVGSGGWPSLSAVDLGKTAKEAVEYAMTRDCFTGGKVHVYDIKKAKFL